MKPVRLFSSLVFLFFLFYGLAAPGQAQTIIYVDADESAPGDGTSWGSAYPALQDAFDQANANPSTDYEIWIAKGTYYPDLDNVDNDGDGSEEHTADSDTSFTLTRDDVEVYGGFSGGESSRSSRDPDANIVTLSGDIGQDDGALEPNTDSDNDSTTPSQTDHINGTNATHVLLFDGTDGENISSSTILDGVTVTGGKADGSGSKKLGGGFLCDGSGGNVCNPKLTDLTIQGNYGVKGGGGANDGRSNGTASPSLTSVRFRWNVAEELGGGLHNVGSGGVSGESNPSIDGGKFQGNVSSKDGGAIQASAAGAPAEASPNLTGVTLKNNTADRFGGALSGAAYSGSTVSPQITNCTFSENGDRNSTTAGGAIEVFAFAPASDGNLSKSKPTIQESSFSNNEALRGGAIKVSALSAGVVRPDISDSQFSQNRANRGGAIEIEGDTTSSGGVASEAGASIQSSTFTDNQADDRGGAFFIEAREGGEADPSLSDVTFKSNQAHYGGAIEVFSDSTDDADNPSIASPSISRAKFFSNEATGISASSGGAFVNRTDEGGTATPTVTNSVFSGNSANSNGGAVNNTAQKSGIADPSFTNVTFAGNKADGSGGAIATRRLNNTGSASLALINTILWNNTADADGNGSGSGNEISLSDASASASYSIIDGGCPTGVSCGTNLLNEDPQFAGSNQGAGSDGTFGTSDDDLRLQGPDSGGGASAAIDAGDNTAISENKDLGGNTRNYEVSGVTNTANTPNGNPPVDFGAHESLGDPLPVELVAFEGHVDGSSALLSWETASEENNAGFAVQRKSSSEGWKRLGFVETKAPGGRTSEPQSYRFRDSDLPFASDSLVYRLKQIDSDGFASYSEPTIIERTPTGNLTLLAPAPNPAQTRTTVRFSLPEETGSKARLTLYDVMGRQVRTIQLPAAQGRHKHSLNVQALASGVYFLKLQAEGQVRTQKVTVTR